jgi:tetrapyrrole methylase family protein/MazG family protein
LARFAIEEAFELAEALDGGSSEKVKEELGDVLLQVLLNAEIARQEGRFDLSDVIETLGRKMVRRHPHVFGEVKVKDSQQVLRNWDQIKKAEATAAGEGFAIPQALPALLRAHKIGEKTERLGFDWPSIGEVMGKVREELVELEEAIASGETKAIAHEVGDLLFSVAQLARHASIDGEQCLRRCNSRFEARFHEMRRRAASDGKNWADLSDTEKESYWRDAKAHLAKTEFATD